MCGSRGAAHGRVKSKISRPVRHGQRNPKAETLETLNPSREARGARPES